jgi:hypothetical protein
VGGINASEYANKTNFSTSDGDPPNQGSNQVSWDNLGDVPAGFADGVDNTEGGGIGGSGAANYIQVHG